jgi:membrane protease YdiL (CAAX protease family)
VQLLGQWSLVLLVLWPLARGMRFDQFCNEVGWRRGRGVLHEIGAGLAAYIAALPIYVAVAITVAILMWAVRQITGADPPMPDNRVFEIFEKGTPAMTALLASLVVIWAPLVEETIFRGALFRAVRPRAGAVGAALLTAAMFALMHQYGLPQLIVVGTLGVIFALMREWRGSLLPSMTAHAVHNFMVMVILLVVIQFARG